MLEKLVQNKILISGIIFLSFLLPSPVQAGATLYLSPASGESRVGETIKAVIFLNTGNNPVNAAEGTLSFDSNILEATSISKNDSIFSLWAVEPTFDNNRGAISFAGGTPTPFKGSAGKVVAISFRVKTASTAILNFNSGRILLADGQGTDIFSGSQGANWKLADKKTLKEQPESKEVPSVPFNEVLGEITSLTHPDQSKFYNNNNPQLKWSLTQEVVGTSFLIDEKADTTSDTITEGLVSEAGFQDFKDGIWYFHLRLKNTAGWGKTIHYRIGIDTAPPEPFDIKFFGNKVMTTSTAQIYFKTDDKLSGIDHYEVKIGEGDWFQPQADGFLLVPVISSGEHELVIKAIDRAGNVQEAKDLFVVRSAEEIQPNNLSTTIINNIIIIILIVIIGYLIIHLYNLKKIKGRA